MPKSHELEHKCLVARKPNFGACEQHRHRPDYVSAQSDQHLCKYLLSVKYIDIQT